MSRPYSNRPFVPSRRRVSLQMCEFVSYPTTESNDTPSNSASWQLTDPLSYIHQPPTLISPAPLPPPPPPPISTQNDFSYFQYPPHRQTLESPLIASNREPNNNNNNNQHVHHFNESHPSCHFQHSGTNDIEQTRSSLPFSRVTAAATATASAPHYRLESPSAAAFTRYPPWFDHEREDNNDTMPRSSRNNNHHTKRQRSSAVSTPTSQSSQSYHHPERKRSRQETDNDENEQINLLSSENVSQQQYRPSSHHHYQPYPNHRPTQVAAPPTARTSYIDHVPSLSRSFEQLSQPILRNRIEHTSDIMNSHIHYGPHHHPVQPLPSTQSRHIYHPTDHRQFILEPPPVASPRHQSIPPPPPPPPPSRSYTSQQNRHQRSGIAFEQGPQRAPLFHRTSMTTHMHQRPSPSFLTDLLHRVIDAHAASYSDNQVHHYHHHPPPPPASIDLIAYAWMSPSHDIFSLPAAFSIHFGDFFDLTMPDETPVVGLTDTELERLPTIIYSQSCTTIEADDKCAVCLSEYIGGEKLKRLRCKHFFHSECIDPWLKTSTRCPICRGEQTS